MHILNPFALKIPFHDWAQSIEAQAEQGGSLVGRGGLVLVKSEVLERKHKEGFHRVMGMWQ